jgi:hypothetical protein
VLSSRIASQSKLSKVWLRVRPLRELHAAVSFMPEPLRNGSKLYKLGAHISTFVCDVKFNRTKYVLMVSSNAVSSTAFQARRRENVQGKCSKVQHLPLTSLM